MPSLRLAAAGLLGLAFAASCANSSSPLARRDDGPAGQGGAGSGGSAGTTGSAGTIHLAGQTSAGSAGSPVAGAAGDTGVAGTGGSGLSGSSGQTGSSGSPPVVVEPDGAPEFRFLDGVTDVASVRLCLVPWGASAPLGTDSTPEPAAGLAYGDLLTPTVPAGVDVATTALRPHVIGGALDATKGKSCLALLASPPAGVRVAALPVLPAGTLGAPRSRLAVATGCLGGFDAPYPFYTCGPNVDPVVGNPGLVLVDVSRTPPASGTVGLQFVQASAATAGVRLQSVNTTSATTATVTLVPSLGLGQVAPRPPLQGTRDGLFGIDMTVTKLNVIEIASGGTLASLPVLDTLSASGLTADDLAPGQAFFAVLLGPKPGAPVTDPPPVAPTRLRWFRAPTL